MILKIFAGTYKKNHSSSFTSCLGQQTVHLKGFHTDNLFCVLYTCIDTMCSLQREKKYYLKIDVKDNFVYHVKKTLLFELH